MKNAGTLREIVRYGAGFAASGNLLANTPETVVAAASNVSGLIVWEARAVCSASGIYWNLAAKTSAPAGVPDGDVILAPDNHSWDASNARPLTGAALARPVFVPAGKGLYFISAAATTFMFRSVLYTIL